MQIDHDARPSLSVNIVNQFNDFLRDSARANPSMPDSVQKLQNDAGIKLVLANLEDPDQLGCFKQYRVAFYIARGSVLLGNVVGVSFPFPHRIRSKP